MAKTGSWVYRNGKLVPKHKASPLPRGEHSDLPCPMVITDDLGVGLKGLRHMGTGKMLDSKSSFRKEDKAIGATCIGNDKSRMDPKPRKWIEPKSPHSDIKKAIRQLRKA